MGNFEAFKTKFKKTLEKGKEQSEELNALFKKLPNEKTQEKGNTEFQERLKRKNKPNQLGM